MNALHWHLTDDESFPLCLDSAKILCDSTRYGKNLIYTYEDVAHIKEYAIKRGVVM